MLSWWNSQEVIPGWAIAKQQRLAALQAPTVKGAMWKTTVLVFAITMFLALIAR